MSMVDLDELANDLADLATVEKKGGRSAREERVIAGFEEVKRFVAEYGSVPRHGEDRDIFERIYAVRLNRLRKLPEYLYIMEPLDEDNLLSGEVQESVVSSVDDLAAELSDLSEASDLTELRHVRSTSERRAAGEIASRAPCEDFESFRHLFESVQADLAAGIRKTVNYEKKDTGLEHDASISKGDWFILEGQIVFVAEVGDIIKAPNGSSDARLRAIYSNGTESDILKRSLQRALYKDETGRRISEPSAGPLFSSEVTTGDTESGTVYVLRSKSEHPDIAKYRSVLHKIGVTGSRIETRIANAKLDPTFLMADVEVIATYELFNINRVKLENLIHRFFTDARLDLSIKDRFGNPTKPREWFLVPLAAIDKVISLITDNSLIDYRYDSQSASVIKK